MSALDRLLSLRRARADRPRPLASGRLVPRLARWTALALVSLGWRPDAPDRARAAEPGPGPAPAPEPCVAPTARLGTKPGARPTAPPLSPSDLPGGLGLFATMLDGHVNRGAWPRLRARLLDGAPARGLDPSPLADAIEAHLKDPGATTPATARRLLELARQAQHPDLALVGWAFRVARPVAERADLDAAEQDALAALFAEASRHARIHQAIVETLAETGPVTFRPWMSKAAPRADYSGVVAPDGFWPALERRLPTATAGAWDDPALDVTVVSGGPGARLLAWGASFPLADGQPLQLTRLDLVRAGDTALVLVHATLGVLTVPPGRALTALDAHHLVTPEARKRLDDLVGRALRCDGDALSALAAVMPAAHVAIRAAVGRPAPPPPMRDGAPALRLLLAIFDE